MWSTVLKIIADFDVIARWHWEVESGFVLMAVPEKNEILEDRFVEDIDSHRNFDELNILEIDRIFKAGSFVQVHDLEEINNSIQMIAGIMAVIKNDRLTIKAI